MNSRPNTEKEAHKLAGPLLAHTLAHEEYAELLAPLGGNYTNISSGAEILTLIFDFVLIDFPGKHRFER